MTGKKKEGKKADKAAALTVEDAEPHLKDFMTLEMFTSWQVSDTMVSGIIEKVMKVLKDKEIAIRVPQFSVDSTMQLFKKTINYKDFQPDRKKDDIHICKEDAEEMPPPPMDSHGRHRALNKPDLLAKFAQELAEFGEVLPAYLLTHGSMMSKKSSNSLSQSNRSRLSYAVSTLKTVAAVSAKATPRKKTRRSDSGKKRAMEKKLLAYY